MIMIDKQFVRNDFIQMISDLSKEVPDLSFEISELTLVEYLILLGKQK